MQEQALSSVVLVSTQVGLLAQVRDIRLAVETILLEYVKMSSRKDLAAIKVQQSLVSSLFHPYLAYRNLELSAEKKELVIDLAESLKILIDRLTVAATEEESLKILQATLQIVELGIQREVACNKSYWFPWRQGSPGDLRRLLEGCKDRLEKMLAQSSFKTVAPCKCFRP